MISRDELERVKDYIKDNRTSDTYVCVWGGEAYHSAYEDTQRLLDLLEAAERYAREDAQLNATDYCDKHGLEPEAAKHRGMLKCEHLLPDSASSIRSCSGVSSMATELKPCPFCGGEANTRAESTLSDKKYLVTEKYVDLDQLFEFENMSVCEVDDWLAAHEYRERPCDSRRVGRIVVDHGSHGPEPKFKGDVWTVSYRCSVCNDRVSKDDAYCRHCGVELRK